MKGVLRNFTKFIGKHLRPSLFFNKVAVLRPKACNFIRVSSCCLLIKTDENYKIKSYLSSYCSPNQRQYHVYFFGSIAASAAPADKFN